jgi:maltose alpha-D-glucosyltransferase/alpha-amylase
LPAIFIAAFDLKGPVVRRRLFQTDSEVVKDDVSWYKDAVIYELHVRAFSDSNADGIGDFRGLVRKLDYLQDLGVTAVWLLPFYPSPMRDDGYDIADYTGINSIYGSVADFKLFLRAAHRRGLRVITELVLNHTSDRHPWFQRARRAAPDSPERDFYVWSHTPERFKEARIIFKDFEPSNWTWDAVAQAYYWHRFFSHQPDLNFDNPEVHKAIFQTLDFWLGMGIDGLRLDAVPYLYEREGTNGENLPETHAFLRRLRRHVEERYANRMLLAEANQWPEDAVAYFGRGDECHMAFHFPVMPRLFMAIRMEDRFPIIDILQQTPHIPESSQWALFLRNHDELTLEMVTDEDRDYMYRMYAQDPQARINLGIRRRLAPLLENHRGKIELMNGLLFSLPGTPVIYYGDEIGMGDNIYLGDRNGVRTPMQWSPERNAGFSRANPQRLYLPIIIDPAYHFETVNVEAQQNNSHSLLWWMKHLIALRKRFQAFGRGSLEFVPLKNSKVLAFVRRFREERILVVANLSRFPQYAELDLSAFKNLVPVELFGKTAFPAVGEQPYFLSLGSYAFYWFNLEVRQPVSLEGLSSRPTPVMLSASGTWESIFTGKTRESLEEALASYLRSCPWFTGKHRQIEAAMVLETIPINSGQGAVHVTLVQVEYTEGDAETYVVPLGFASGRNRTEIEEQLPTSVIAQVHFNGSTNGNGEGVLFDSLGEKEFSMTLLEAIGKRRRFRRADGEIAATPLVPLGRLSDLAALPPPRLMRPEQSNSAVAYGDKYVLKFFRRLEEGTNPEVEVERSLAEKTSFSHAPVAAGTVEYRRSWGQPMTLAVLQKFVSNQGDAWRLTLDALLAFYERVLTGPGRIAELPAPPSDLWEQTSAELPRPVEELIGPYVETARLVGRRTAEFHRAMASINDDANFVPEAFTPLDQRSRYQSVRTQIRQSFELLRRRLPELSETLQAMAKTILDMEPELLARSRRIIDGKFNMCKIRCHGNYHLGQLLYTGKDIVIIDFDGEVTRPLTERRRKRLSLGDLACMMRSFHYASQIALARGDIRAEDVPTLQPWARFWYGWTCCVFLTSYRQGVGALSFLPSEPDQWRILLEYSLLRRVLREIRTELGGAAEHLAVPFQGLLWMTQPAAV